MMIKKRIPRVHLVLLGIKLSPKVVIGIYWCEKHETLYRDCPCLLANTDENLGNENYPIIEVVD